MAQRLQQPAVLIVLLMTSSGLVFAKGPPPGDIIKGLQVQLELEDGQPQPVHTTIRMRLTVKNVGLRPLVLYQRDWSERVVVAGVVDREQSFELVRFRGLLRCAEYATGGSSERSQEAFVQLDPGDSLIKLLGCQTQQPGQHDVAVVVNLTEDDYEAAVGPEDAQQAWTGTVTSNLVRVEVVGTNATSP